MATEAPNTPVRVSRSGALKWVAAIGTMVIVAVVVLGVLARARQAASLKTWTAENQIPTVSVALPTPAGAGQALVLPGALSAYYNASIFARVSGYVRRWYVDIGDHVHTGQVLADIDTPELDQQLMQARANLESVRANMRLAEVTAHRWNGLLAQDAVSRQESDEKAGDLAAKTAQVNASQAEVNRLLSLKRFARITAPFDGVVTARRTDIGALINAGASAANTAALFDVSKVDRLRLYVHVPQSLSERIYRGMTANLTVPEYAGRSFEGVLTNTSNAVSESSGTLLAEFSVDNRAGRLKAGDFAQVTLSLPRETASSVLRVPSTALIFRKSGLQLATVGPGDRVIMRSVTSGRNLGPSVEISSGLGAQDRVIDNPPDSISQGDLVRVVADHVR